MYNDILRHHGIKNQKWGVRHGPPYPLGSTVSSMVKRGKGGQIKNANKQTKKPKSKTREHYDRLKSKDVRDMTNDEIQELVTRLEYEKKYSDAISNKSTTKKGKKYVDRFIKTMEDAAFEVIKKQTTNAINRRIADIAKKTS